MNSFAPLRVLLRTSFKKNVLSYFFRDGNNKTLCACSKKKIAYSKQPYNFVCPFQKGFLTFLILSLLVFSQSLLGAHVHFYILKMVRDINKLKYKKKITKFRDAVLSPSNGISKNNLSSSNIILKLMKIVRNVNSTH